MLLVTGCVRLRSSDEVAGINNATVLLVEDAMLAGVSIDSVLVRSCDEGSSSPSLLVVGPATLTDLEVVSVNSRSAEPVRAGYDDDDDKAIGIDRTSLLVVDGVGAIGSLMDRASLLMLVGTGVGLAVL